MRVQKEQRPFLFINKSSGSDSLSNSDAKEKAKLLSHVQKRRRRLDALSASPAAQSPSSRAIVRKNRGTEPRDRCPSTNQQVEREQPQTETQDMAPIELVLMSPADNGTDPFHCTVVGRKFNPHPFLQFGVCEVASSTLLGEAFAPLDATPVKSPFRHQKIFRSRLLTCISEPLLMYSTMAFSSSSLAWTHGRVYPDCPPDFFVGQTLTAVSKAITCSRRPYSPWILTAVYTLGLVELWNSVPSLWIKCPGRASMATEYSRDNARTHLKALIELIDGFGGPRQVHPYIIECAILLDACLAMASRTRPILPFDWHPEPFPPSTSLISDYRRCASLTCNEGLDSISMSTVLKSVTTEITQFVNFAPLLWQKGPNEAEESWLYLRFQSLQCQLLSLTSLDGFDECIRVTNLLFLLQCTLHSSAAAKAATVVGYLHQALLAVLGRSDLPKSTSQRQLLFWCFCTGGMTGQSLPTTSWFDAMLLNLCGEMSIPLTFTSFQPILDKFLFRVGRQQSKLNDSLRRLKDLDQQRWNPGFKSQQDFKM